MSKITQYSGTTLGADPEIFVRNLKTGLIVPSMEVLRKTRPLDSYGNHVVPDGVQLEFHPRPASCTGRVGDFYRACIVDWQKELEKHDLTLDFTPTIKITDEEWNTIPTEARQLGCNPSLNIWDTFTLQPNAEYRWRSAGGHLHIGFKSLSRLYERRADVIPLCDYLIGNTFVLFDRDPYAAVRRESYGRAGEYRLPDYGVEYRTLSNVWLRAFPLAQLVYALGRAVISTADSSLGAQKVVPGSFPIQYTTELPEVNFAGELLSCVDSKDIIEAINTNNADLAMRNFKKIAGWIAERWVETSENSMYTAGGDFPLSKTKIDDFLFFVEKGLDHWFGGDLQNSPKKWWAENFVMGSYSRGAYEEHPVQPPQGTMPYHVWITSPEYRKWQEEINAIHRRNAAKQSTSGSSDPGHGRGWNSFLLEVVRPARLKALADASAIPAAVMQEQVSASV